MSLDTPPLLDGDAGFGGLNMKLQRDQLPAGTLARAENIRLRTGAAESRFGTVRPSFAQGMTQISGAGVYSNPNGDRSLLIHAAGDVWQIRDGASPVQIPLPNTLLHPELRTGDHGEFVQTFDKVILFSTKAKPLVWDGVSASGFQPIHRSADNPDYVDVIPDAETAELAMGRLLVPYDKDKVAVSDLGDYTVYDKTLSWSRLNTGTSDALVRLFPYSEGNVLVFKEQSIALWTNFYDPASVRLQDLDRSLGLCGRRTPQIAGDSIYFLSNPSGLRRIRQNNSGRLEVDPVPVSDAIDPIIRRINWRRAGRRARTAVLGDYLYLSVPLDDEVSNHSILVLNLTTGQWESAPDTWAANALQIDELCVFDYQGRSALYAIDGGNVAIYVLYVDGATTDGLATGDQPIATLLETRGYVGGDAGRASWKQWKRAEFAIATADPSVTVTAITDGVNEESVLTPTPITRNRLKFFNQHADYDFSSPAFGVNDPRREDYSTIVNDNAQVQTVTLGRRQETIERLSARTAGRWMSLRVANTKGFCGVRGVTVEGLPANRNRRIA